MTHQELDRPMTPQEIVDHKRKWIPFSDYDTDAHTDLRRAVREWCKDHCFQWRYDIKEFTDVYFDTVRFELEEDFTAFNEWYIGVWERD